MISIKIREIRGRCSIYKICDKIVKNDLRILLNRTDALCIHVLSTLFYYIIILKHDWCQVKLELIMSEDIEHTYMQCVNSGKPYTEDGTVIFECHKIQREFDK